MSQGYQIAINFSNPDTSSPGTTGRGSSTEFLNQVLTRLNAAIDKLTNALNKQMFISGNSSGGVGGGGNMPPSNQTSQSSSNSNFSLGRLLTTSTIAAVAVTTVRWMSANANALMAQAGNRGAFAGAGILGKANQSFSSYVGNFYDIERQREISRNLAIGQAAGSVAGGAIGAGLGGGLIGGAAGAGIGTGAGDYATARLVNANIQQAMLIEKAYAEREAAASTSEWQTGFSRFGLARTNRVIASSALTGGAPIEAHLSQAFENKYGTVNGAFNPNYNAILNNIVPYLQHNPMDTSQTGNLNAVAQNFQKAGFAVSQFSELTIQGSQYQALTGKNLQQFSEDLKSARSKFGDVYDISSNQTALNLMAMGYNSSDAQNIAFQSKYNSGIANTVSQFTSLSPQSYYSALALNKPLGFNLFKTLKSGQFQGSGSKRAQLLKDIQTAENGGGLSNDLLLLESQGYSLGQVSQWLQPKVTPYKGSVNEKGGYSDAQMQAMKDLTDGIKNALNNVGNMVVNATNVQIYNANPGTLQSNLQSSPITQRAEKAAIDYLSPDANLLRNALNYLSGKRPLSK